MTREKSCCARNLIVGILALFLAAGTAAAQSRTDPLKSGFENPPNGTKPRVWWHWMDGNITKEGIKLDLEWMQRVGLGGLHIFDIAISKNDCCSFPRSRHRADRVPDVGRPRRDHRDGGGGPRIRGFVAVGVAEGHCGHPNLPGDRAAGDRLAEGLIAPDDDLLQPTFYIAPQLKAWLAERAAAYKALRSWVV
ncbi:MAG: glycosyl hydrolase [Bryobacteraceae bacterium]